jgi:uncharacterized membrane protein
MKKRLKSLAYLALLFFSFPALMTAIIVHSMPDLVALTVFKWAFIFQMLCFVCAPWWVIPIFVVIVIGIWYGD